jgi:hypothetical protein
MLQWLPGSSSEVVWNDRIGSEFVSHILDVNTGKRRTLPFPIYCLSHSGRWALAPDFRRLNDCRPGYGYAGIPDPNALVPAPKNAGIWRVDLSTGEVELLLSFAEVVQFARPEGYSQGAKHWFNHLLVAPGDERFVFLHRWRGIPERSGWRTRMITASADGREPHVLISSDHVSHFGWRDKDHILCYCSLDGQAMDWSFRLIRDRDSHTEVVSGMPLDDGHCSYLPGGEWILCDTYPGRGRRQRPYLLHVPTARRFDLGGFYAPRRYEGEWRCDLHPRFSPDGKWVAVDSAHGGNGRQVYLVDIGSVTGRGEFTK